MKRVAELIGFLVPSGAKGVPGRTGNSLFRLAAAFILILSAGLPGSAPLHAQTAPAMISFQGRLTDTLNNPLEGNHTLSFAIYTVPAGGTPLWTETQAAVPAVNGALTAQLGSVVPIPPEVFSGAGAYLEITVDGVVLSPRERLVTVPYAFNARLLDGSGPGAFVSTANVNQAIGGTKTFTGNIDMNGTGRIISLAAPAAPQDAATKGYVDAAVLNSSTSILASTQTFTGANTWLNQVNISSDIYLSAGRINLHGNLVTTPAGLLDATKLENTVPSALLDNSSVTKQGNVFNGVGQLLRLDGTGRLPAVDGSQLLNVVPSSYPASYLSAGTFGAGIYLPAAQVLPGSLDPGVIASSVAAGAVGDLQIGGGISQSKITNLVAELGANLARLDQLAVDTATIAGNLADEMINLGIDTTTLKTQLDAKAGTGANTFTGALTINSATALTTGNQPYLAVSTNIYISGSQLRIGNFSLPPPAGAAGAGSLYYNTVDGQLYVSNGASWTPLVSGGASSWTGSGTGSVTLIANSDKVGIGKSPSRKLDVGGDIGADYGVTAATMSLSNTGAAALDVAGGIQAGSGNVNIIGADGRVPALSSLYFANLDGSALTNIGLQNFAAVAADTTTLNATMVHLAGAETITGAKTFSANLAVMNGNLGVGVAAATAKLEVKAADTQNYSLAIGTGTAYNFVVSTSGAVGVGTPSPRAKMEVTGGANSGEYIMIFNAGDKAAAWLKNK